MDLKTIGRNAVVAILLLAAGAAIGRYTLPAKVVTKTEIKVVEKEVEKSKETTIKDTNKNRELVITETTKPDGTKIVEKHYINRDEIKEDTTKINHTTTTVATSSKSSTVTTNEKNDYNFAILAGVNSGQSLLDKQIGYGGIVQRRIIGPIYLGVWGAGFGTPYKSGGISLGGSF